MLSIKTCLVISVVICALAIIGAIALGLISSYRTAVMLKRRKELSLRRKKNGPCQCDEEDNSKRPRRRFPIKPFQLVVGGIFLSAFMLFLPIHYDMILESNPQSFTTVINSIFVSMHNTIRLFILDGEFDIIRDAEIVLQESVAFYRAYTFFASILYLAAPILTAGVVLSFFKNITAYFSYYRRLPAKIYLISELNMRSIALAEDILSGPNSEKGRRIVIFSDVFEKDDDEANYELVRRAKNIGALLFAKDVIEIGLRPEFGKVERRIFLIGDNEDENVKQALAMIPRYTRHKVYNNPHTHFYVFSRSFESEVLLDSINSEGRLLKVRRVDENRSFVLRTLLEHPIFDEYIEEPDGTKKLNIVLVGGLGLIGSNFVKALSWVGQMYSYELNLHIFDAADSIEKKLRGMAPELIDKNRDRTEGEPYYNFVYHDSIDVKTHEFLEDIEAIGDVTTVYVALGDDELNIETAMRMRMQFERGKIKRGGRIPSIYAIVYSEIKNHLISNCHGLRSTDKADNDYGITLIGSLRSSYSVDAIEQKRLDDLGLACHLKWSSSAEGRKSEKDRYNKFEYYRRSSMAEALHAILRGNLGLVPTAENEELHEHIFITEHKRWSAFIRSEGYVYADKKRDMAKTHNCLKPYDQLDYGIKLLDQIVVTDVMVDGKEVE